MRLRDRAGRGRARILHVLASDHLGGTELMLVSLAEQLDRNLIETSVGFLDRPGPIAERLEAADIETHSLGGGGIVASSVRLASLLRRGQYDLVNAYGFKASMIARFCLPLAAPRTTLIAGVRALHTTETENLRGPKARLVLTLERMTSALVAVYDANSRGAVEFLTANGINPNRIRYIPNGLDVARWSHVKTRPASQAPLVLCVARFVPRKRHVDLVHALALLRERGVSYRAVLAGTGPTLEAVHQEARRLRVDDAVEFPGRVEPEDLPAVMVGTRVFCLPSAWEGMPGSVMEAMAGGVAVVATRVSGTDEIVVDGVTGILVPPARPDLLADALSTVLEDAELARQMGERGRERIATEFSLERMARAKQDLFLALAARDADPWRNLAS